MAKKNFTKGLDSFFTPTVKPVSEEVNDFPGQQKKSVPTASSGDDVKVIFRLPSDIKMQLDLHCVRNRITKQDFISNLIINSLDA